MRRCLLRAGLGLGLPLLLFTGLVGWAHTPSGRALRPLLFSLAKMQGAACPLGYDRALSPAERAAGRRRFAARHAGTTRAGGRPALGWALDGTTRGSVLSWAAQHGVRCSAGKNIDLRCTEVASGALPRPDAGAPLSELWLSFDEGDRLVAVVAVRRDADAARIGDSFDAADATVARLAGEVARREGALAELHRGPLAMASVEYRFSNYYALARAANMGDAYVLTEEYRSLPVDAAP